VLILPSVSVTHYCSCAKCCGKYADGFAADGSTAKAGTVAADWRVIDRHSTVVLAHPRLWVTGVTGGEFVGTVHDVGGAIKGHRIDLWCPTHQRALVGGRFRATVSVYEPDEPVRRSTTPANPGKPTLRKGNRGPAVRLAQERLLHHDPDCLPTWGADTVFGNETNKAVRAFQRTHHRVDLPHASTPLKVDGIVGPNTWAALLAD
jgi:3D (Asp-Asp-Asp) domain-containing protein